MTFSTSPVSSGPGRWWARQSRECPDGGPGPGRWPPAAACPAGELTGIVGLRSERPIRARSSRPSASMSARISRLRLLEVRLLLGQQLLGQCHVLQGCVLGEEVEGLEHHAEVEAFPAHLALPLSSGVRRVEQGAALDDDLPVVRSLQKVQAPQKGGLAGARGADDGQGLPLLRSKLMSWSTLVARSAFRCAVLPESPYRDLLLTERTPASAPACPGAPSPHR